MDGGRMNELMRPVYARLPPSIDTHAKPRSHKRSANILTSFPHDWDRMVLSAIQPNTEKAPSRQQYL